MKKILYIDVCGRAESRTRILAQHLLTYLDGEVTCVDLFEEPVYPLNIEAIRQRRDCVECGSCDGQGLNLARQFADADIIVIAAPVWNLSFPSVLAAYCENVVEEGVTIHIDEYGNTTGLCKAKKFYYVTATGTRNMNPVFGFGYLKSLFSQLGVHSAECFSAEALDIPGADVDMILNICKREIDASFRFPAREDNQVEANVSTK
ncbi:MAG: NAD(P)H-dependent oxidoreductase [Oscillospiraceae bacterium]|nr:NAD(P)H-dependent oxidoreductase [Oscillospiraceae bacterium]